MLKGRTAVVTGCLKGIGRAVMEVFAENGADVFACCQLEDELFRREAAELAAGCGVEIWPVVFDLADEAAVKNAAVSIQKTKRTVDCLANVAGMTVDALFHMATTAQMQKVFQINFFSPMVFTQYITRLMLKNGGGSVINVASISAQDGNPGQLAYSAAKGALISATKTLSMELAPRGVRVNAVAPGVIDTALTATLPAEALGRQMGRAAIRRLGTAREVARVIAFLASDRSSYMTGQVIRIDGGIG